MYRIFEPSNKYNSRIKIIDEYFCFKKAIDTNQNGLNHLIYKSINNENMNAKERFNRALNHQKTDRLPVTTHHILDSFMDKYMPGKDVQDFFDEFKLDPICWISATKPNKGEYYDPTQGKLGFLETARICSDNWRFETITLDGYNFPTKRLNIITPDKTLSMVLQSNIHTSWISERLIKEKNDIDIIAKYITSPLCDIDAINKAAADFGNRGMLRGSMLFFDGLGQPGCWQDAACLFGIQELIMATFEDPDWVHAFLRILMEHKLPYVRSMKGANYDLIDHGGGDASTTVISPDIFDDFVAFYDEPLVVAAHEAGQKVVYHTCGGMMPILENIADMKVDAMETFTPEGMGGDTILAEAKRRIGAKVCMIGGFDQFHFFTGCTEKETRAEVRRCFEETGEGGGFILSPSDHFFDADFNLIKAFSDEARKCTY
ncbi:MAG: uroporphyrinogen decarboxylase family protein [Bacteroidota bacterium]